MKHLWASRPDNKFFLIVSYCLWAAVTLRWITVFVTRQHPLTWAVTLILLLFALLLGLEPLLTQGIRWRVYLYLAGQTGLVFLATLFHFELDFFALLYVPICGQAVYLLPRREGRIWLGILVGVTAVALLIQFNSLEAISFILLYTAALVFVAAFVTMTRQAIETRQRSEQFLAELQDAHAQLQAYAAQAEELAIANERNRLARDLHDAVAQTLYGLTLQAAAAKRQLAAGQTEVTQIYLDEIQQSARQSLQETRLLIYELRPPLLEQEGLAAALQARLSGVEGRNGLNLHLELEPVTALSPTKEMALFRVAQEAFNNVTKHAMASELHVRLSQQAEQVVLEVADNGVGFDPEHVAAGSLGLQGMAERVQQVNGRFTLHSAPHAGTTILIEVPL